MPEVDPELQPAMPPLKAKAFVQAWTKEIDDALKREKRFRSEARHCVDLYEAREPDETPFAILYSNTETLLPAIYNSVPIPIVQRRFKDPDPNGRAVSEVSTRMLKFLMDDTGSKDFDTFDDLIQAAVLDAVVTNRGLHRLRYHADENGYEECVYGESVRWDKFLHGYARTWKKVPWIAFEWDFSKDELKKNFPKANFIDLRGVADDQSEDPENKDRSRDELAGVKTYKVYEIWDKLSGKVFFISKIAPEAPLRYIDDPLGLSGFFPVPRPLNFMKKITTLVPTPLYQQYKQQAAELNTITRRLKAIIQAIRFRGMYNSTVSGIEEMLKAEDNVLVPVENVSSMPEGIGMDKLLWIVPINELIQTAQSLYEQREQCKQVIYEITGISDILRGATAASETATAQTIKNQWGTLRLRKMQKEVQRYCRDILIIMLEVAGAKFEQQTVQQMTGLPYLTNGQKQAIGQQIQMATMAAQQAVAAQPPPMPGQPPAPPPQPPQVPPQVQQALQSPSWEDILQTLRNKVILHYKVDIETNSTVDAEASQDKQDIAELLNALSQFLNGVAPLVEQGVLPIEVAKQMLLAVSRRFNFGSQLEDALMMMQAPQPKTDPAAAAKASAEQAKAQTAQQQAMIDGQRMQMEFQLEQQEFEHKKELQILQAQLDQSTIAVKNEQNKSNLKNIQMKAVASALEHEQRLELMKQQKQANSEESD